MFYVSSIVGCILSLALLYVAGAQFYNNTDYSGYSTLILMIPATAYASHLCMRYARLLDIQARPVIAIVQPKGFDASV